MSEEYSQADYERDLGITSPGHAREAETSRELDRELQRIDEGQTEEHTLYQQALGIDATGAEQATAMRKLEEHDRSPWRLEWPRPDRLSRLGEEQELIELYQTRLGESAAAAAEHVHQELSSAWTRHDALEAKLAGVSNRLAYERERMTHLAPLSEHRAQPPAERTFRGQHGKYVQITESNHQRPEWLR